MTVKNNDTALNYANTPKGNTANSKSTSIMSEKAASNDTGLKGKGSNIEAESMNSTSKKMDSFDITVQKVKDVAPFVEKAARENGLPASLIFGVIWVESRFNPEAKSPVGARGLMQLMPKTAKYLAECIKWEGRADSYDPEFNIAAGSYYVSKLIKIFNGDVDLALAAYNAGPGNIEKWMKNTGLPKVSIEYYTMVQTAAKYFGSPGEDMNSSQDMTIAKNSEAAPVIPNKENLDKLGLAILISGLNTKEFGLERSDSAHPFE
ncbi:MAG: lytic transglycosylase domain-containing protein [Deltaproteobacteria bacterium]|nr:lytic transglycosylase domain-containing protein [Deltaproteobacteria bacterium]